MLGIGALGQPGVIGRNPAIPRSTLATLKALLAGSAKSAIWLPTGYSDLYAESARTTPVTAGRGSAVGAVDDYAGNGNHLIQTTTGDRPVAARAPVNGVRNLSKQSYNFADATNWPQGASPTIVAASDGYDITATAAGTSIRQDLTLTANNNHTVAFRLSSASETARSRISVYDSTAPGFFAQIDFTWSGGVPTFNSAAFPPADYALTDEGDGVWRVDMEAVLHATNTAYRIYFYPDVSGNNQTVRAHSFQIEKASSASAYQQVANVNDVTEAGVLTNYFLKTDGAGDCMYRTFTPSSSMTIVMGVKTTDTSLMLLSDSAGGAGFLGVAQVNVATDLGVGDTWIDGVQFVDGVNTRTEVLTALNDGAWHIVEFRNVNLSTWGGLGFFEQFSTGNYSYAGACSGIIAIDVADLGATQAEAARQSANTLLGNIALGA